MISITTKIYILIHGAWHGSWCWHKVVKTLTKLGHIVITPDLPNNHNITLADYITYIEQIITNQTSPVILVGHSMAGVIISQIAENIPDKIEQLIYVSAFIPLNNKSLMDEIEQSNNSNITSCTYITDNMIGIFNQKAKKIFYNECDEQDIKLALKQIQTQPLQPFYDPIKISDQNFTKVKKLYIQCMQDQVIYPKDQQRMGSRLNCPIIQINSDHSPFFSNSDELVRIMLS